MRCGWTSQCPISRQTQLIGSSDKEISKQGGKQWVNTIYVIPFMQTKITAQKPQYVFWKCILKVANI